ncbi:hypothetical protein BGZ73_006542 [Actinomortierella ambigua]|nr:hypothetical protein BGZ73_006542 [Actinomortierella ambigua]
MIRTVSVLAALILLAVLQVVCTAADAPSAQYYLALGDYYLATPDGGKVGSIVGLTRDLEKAALWDIVLDDINTDKGQQFLINHGASALSLTYEKAQPKEKLELKVDTARRWMIVEVEGGDVEIQTVELFEGKHLVIGIIPGDIGQTPSVGLVPARESASKPTLNVQTIEHANQLYMLRAKQQKMLSV